MTTRALSRWRWICFSILFSLCAYAQQNVSLSKLLLPVRSGGQWGYADTSKNMVIAPQFDFANPFVKQIAVVEKNKKAYAIDSTGKILTTGFDQLFILEDTVLSIYLNEVSDTLGGYGIVTTSGFQILPPAYDETYKMDKDLYGFRKDSLWGVVNRNGTIVIEPAYDTIRMLGFNYLLLQKGKKFGLVAVDGTRLLDDVYARIYKPNSVLIAAKKDKGWGAINVRQDLIIPYLFDTIQSISRFFVQVSIGDSIECYFPSAGGNPTSFAYKKFWALDLFWLRVYDYKKNVGVFDTLGNTIVPVKFADVSPAGNRNWYAMDAEKKWGMYSADGKELIPPTFTRIQPFRPGGKVTIAYDGNLPALINANGDILEKPFDQQIIIRGNTVVLLQKDSSGTFLSIDANGKISEKSKYDIVRTIKVGGKEQLNFGTTPSGGSALAYAPQPDSLSWFLDAPTQLWGLRNVYTGNILITPKFTGVKTYASLYTIVEIEGKNFGPAVDGTPTYCPALEGLVDDSTGKYILSVNYTSIFYEDLLRGHGFIGYVRAVLKNGQTALVSTDGTERKIPFTWIDEPIGGYARICVGGKWTINDPGEAVFSVGQFIFKENLISRLSFGSASDSKNFLAEQIKIAEGKWGYIDSTGKIVVSAQYQYAYSPCKGTGIVKKEKKMGLINMSGTILIPFNYDGMGYQTIGNNTTVLVYNSGARYGYIDARGNVKIPADLRKTESLGNGFISFTRGARYGVMNSKGEIILGETYTEILPFSEGIAQVRKGNKWGYIDTTGQEIIPTIYDFSGPFSEGLARVNSKQRWGFVSTTGEIIIPLKYTGAGDFFGASAPVKTNEGFGLIGKNGKWLRKPGYRKFTPIDGTNLFVVRDDYAAGLCRTDGKMILSPRYDGFQFLGEGRIAYQTGLYFGILDTSGKIITTAVFGKIRPFSEHLAAAERDGYYGFINRNGKYIIPPTFRIANSFSENRAFVYPNIGKTGFIDTTGKMVFTLKEGGASGYPGTEGKFLIVYKEKQQINEHRYFINRAGVRLNRILYDDACPFADGSARVKSFGRWGLVSYTGYYLIKPQFTQLDEFHFGLARFQLRTTAGLFSLDGKEILPTQYDHIGFDSELGMVRYEKGNALGYLFSDGRICWAESE
jgi:hypothetical protein